MAKSDMPIARPPRKDSKAYRKWYYIAHREKSLLQSKEWYARNKRRKLQSGRAWDFRNKEKRLASCRKWSSAHAEEKRAKNRKYHADGRRTRNPEVCIRYSSKRRALKRLASVNLRSVSAWVKHIKSLDVVPCYYCNTPTGTSLIHFDHIVPLSKGGPHCIENLCATCPSCNLRKADKPLRLWVKSGQQILEL